MGFEVCFFCNSCIVSSNELGKYKKVTGIRQLIVIEILTYYLQYLSNMEIAFQQKLKLPRPAIGLISALNKQYLWGKFPSVSSSFI